MSILIHLWNNRDRNLSIECNIFRAASIDTWSRIGFSRSRPKLKIHETTITQNLVYELNLLKALKPSLRYDIFESTSEAANGDDLELNIQLRDGSFVSFAIQAKIIYHLNRTNLSDGTYPRMNHTVNGRNQIDLLIEYANENNCIPLYLLYNYASIIFPSNNLCNVDFDITQYGCSIISADYLKASYSNIGGGLSSSIKFSDLHPFPNRPALPWFVLVCCFPDYTLEELANRLLLKKKDIPVSPTKAIDPQVWQTINTDSKNTSDKNGKYVYSENFSTDFKPKFLIHVAYTGKLSAQ